MGLSAIDPETEAIILPTAQQKWPSQPNEQLTAIRDLLRTSGDRWTLDQIANHFSGRTTPKKLTTIAENLDRLEWFGLVIQFPELDIPQWQSAESSHVA